MDLKKMREGGSSYFQGSARDLTPITASADFVALGCIPPWNDKAESFVEEFVVSVQNAA
jgi:hypothetical protein